jgi:hypothetical protein
MSSERQKEIWKKAGDKYRNSEHGSAVRKQYRQSTKGKRARHRTFERAYSTPDGKSAILKSHRNYRETTNGRATVLICDARTRARKTQLPFTITKAWVIDRIQSGICAQTGDAFDYTLLSNNANGRRQTNMFAPSLDQIIPGGGYTSENTQVVCWWWNAFKQNRTDEEAWQHFKVLHKRQST